MTNGKMQMLQIKKYFQQNYFYIKLIVILAQAKDEYNIPFIGIKSGR